MTAQVVPTFGLRKLVPYFQAAPLTLVLALFLIFPIVTIVIVSFFDYDSVQIIPDFIFQNYKEVLASKVTCLTYISTLRFVIITWVLTLFIGFWVAYFLVFHIRSNTTRIALFLLTTIP